MGRPAVADLEPAVLDPPTDMDSVSVLLPTSMGTDCE